MQISENKVASIHYTLKDDAGQVLDSSSEGQPLTYLQGFGNIIPGLEQEMAGKSVGDKFEVTVEPEDAYGFRQDEMIQAVPRSAFDGVDNIEVGMRFQAQTANGPVPVVVTQVEDEQITVDGNHPLAEMKLHFSVEVVDVREASAEELQHGHAHGPGGHDH